MTSLIVYFNNVKPIAIKRWWNVNKSIFPPTNCTSIVVWNGMNTTGLTVGLPKFTLFLKLSQALTYYQYSTVVGLLLSDAILRVHKLPTARLIFKQSIVNFKYFLFVWSILGCLCSSMPYLEYTKLQGKIFPTLILSTRAYASLGDLYTLFYNNGKRVVPGDIYDLINPVSLAHLIMGDGQASTQKYKGLTLCTDNFSNYDVVRLMNVLKIKYDLNTSLQFAAGKPRIYFYGKEMDKLFAITYLHMAPSMMYKIASR